jgi:hypothetical protein
MRHRSSSDITRNSGVQPALLSFFVYTVLAIGMTYPLITHLDSGFLQGVDSSDAYQLAWVLAWVQHALTSHPMALYNAPVFYPTKDSLAFIDTMLPVAILLLPLQLATHNAAIVYNVAVLLAFPLSALPMYLLAAHHSHDRRAAFLAGLIFAFCPYRVRHLEHLNMLNAGCIPLTLLLFDIARTRGGRLAWLGLGASFVLGALMSLYYLAFVLIAICVYILVLRLRRQPILSPGSLRGIEAGIITLPILAAVLWPYIAIQSNSIGPRRLQDMVFFSADLRDYLHTGPQSLLYGWSDGIWGLSPLDMRQYLFPGWIAIALVLFACMAPTHRLIRGEDGIRPFQLARTWMTAAGVLAIFSLGPYLRFFGRFTQIPLPYMALYFILPPFRGLRDVGRYDQVAMAFLATAASLGAAKLFARFKASRASAIFLALSLAIVLEYWTIQRPLIPVQSGSSIPAVYTWLSHQPAGIVVELPICDGKLGGSICGEEFQYMYYQTYHWHTLVNGWAGSYPKDWATRVSTLESFPSAASMALMKNLNVTYVIVHAIFPGQAQLQTWLDAVSSRFRHGVRAIDHIGSDTVIILDHL